MKLSMRGQINLRGKKRKGQAMKSRNRIEVASRLIGKEELCSYLGLGKTSAVKFAVDAGAVKRIGRRCLYDVRILDKAIDNLPVCAEG